MPYILRVSTQEFGVDHIVYQRTPGSGLEVIKLEFILRLKIKHNDWLLANISLEILVLTVHLCESSLNL